MSADRKATEPVYRQSDEAVEMLLRKHLPVPIPGSDQVLCLCDVTRSFLGPIGHRLHVAAELREAGMLLTEPAAPDYGEIRARLVTRDGIGWGDPFCVTPCEPDRDCEIDDCLRDAVWTVEAMGCHYDGDEPPEVGPTADACAGHVSTLMERWTE